MIKIIFIKIQSIKEYYVKIYKTLLSDFPACALPVSRTVSIFLQVRFLTLTTAIQVKNKKHIFIYLHKHTFGGRAHKHTKIVFLYGNQHSISLIYATQTRLSVLSSQNTKRASGHPVSVNGDLRGALGQGHAGDALLKRAGRCFR
jgi:hypothetical protein